VSFAVVCPNGHRSATADYCDQCGLPVAPAARPPATSSPGTDEEIDTSAAALSEPCPVCGAARSGDDRYCEGCGHDFLAPPPAPTTWEAVAAADRRQFERLEVAGIPFPDRYAERRYALDAPTVRIGRSRGLAGETVPEIDLSGRQEDPGVSHLHAVLERQPDGGYALRDLDSTNGTTVNDDPEPVGPEAAVPLSEGDRIRLGAWTTITLRRGSEVVGREQS
jgi:hypothetical protein